MPERRNQSEIPHSFSMRLDSHYDDFKFIMLASAADPHVGDYRQVTSSLGNASIPLTSKKTNRDREQHHPQRADH